MDGDHEDGDLAKRRLMAMARATAAARPSASGGGGGGSGVDGAGQFFIDRSHESRLLSFGFPTSSVTCLVADRVDEQ
jgi:hypothetical protein